MIMKNIFKSLFNLFKRLSLFLQFIMNIILLTFVYFIGVGIVSLFARISNKKFLNSTNKSTYWREYKEDKNYYRMF